MQDWIFPISPAPFDSLQIDESKKFYGKHKEGRIKDSGKILYEKIDKLRILKPRLFLVSSTQEKCEGRCLFNSKFLEFFNALRCCLMGGAGKFWFFGIFLLIRVLMF